jgi:hypothetical protein
MIDAERTSHKRYPGHLGSETSGDTCLVGGGVGEAAIGPFFDAIPNPADRTEIASGNAEALFHLT